MLHTECINKVKTLSRCNSRCFQIKKPNVKLSQCNRVQYITKMHAPSCSFLEGISFLSKFRKKCEKIHNLTQFMLPAAKKHLESSHIK